MKLRAVIALLLSLVPILAAPCHQERQIYYSQYDNVCRYGSGNDQIILAISIDGIPAKRLLGRAETFCRQSPIDIKYAGRIVPAPCWSYITGDTLLKFNEEPTYHFVGGILISLVQNTTLSSPALIGNQHYNCAIIGNSQILHYGAIYIDHQPPEIHIGCTSIPKEYEEPIK